MGYTNSSLVSKKNITTKCNPRKYPITKITIHHAAGVISMENLLNYLATTNREVSANYVIGNDGKIGLNVEEKNRAWTSSNAENDHKAVTIEVSNNVNGEPWSISDAAMKSLIKLCADICKRNGIKELKFDGTPNGSLTYHYMFASTSCPGTYIKSKTNYICSEVNKLIAGSKGKSTTSAQTKTVSLSDIARDVIAGKYGNGVTRVHRLANAGYDPALVQRAVNDILAGKTVSGSANKTSKSVNQVANEVIQGLWGNGADRKKRLEAAGYNYKQVQNEVNRLLK